MPTVPSNSSSIRADLEIARRAQPRGAQRFAPELKLAGLHLVYFAIRQLPRGLLRDELPALRGQNSGEQFALRRREWRGFADHRVDVITVRRALLYSHAVTIIRMLGSQGHLPITVSGALSCRFPPAERQ